MYSRYLLFITVFSLATALSAGKPERTIYAHYMGNYPAATGRTAHYRSRAHLIRHDAKGHKKSLGGKLRNWPLLPEKTRYSLKKSAELEIKRAMRIGIDGFAVDAWAGANDAKKTLSALFKAAEEMNAPFYLTICLDPNCHKPVKPDGLLSAYENTLRWFMKKHGKSPKLARRNGKPLIFGYHSRGLGRDKRPKDALKNSVEWEKMAGLYKELEKRLGQEFYFHFGLGAFFFGVDLNKLSGARPPHQPGPWMVKAAGSMAKHFPAVGAFIDRDIYSELPAMAKAVQANGAEWSQPLWHQYQRIGGMLMVKPGTDILRDRWQLARKSGSTLIQYVTWNDYGEATNLAPCYRNRYAIYDLTGYFIRWWKQDKPPKIDHDRIYIFYRNYPKGSKTYPFRSQRFVDGKLEVLTLLTKPGEIRLPGRNITYHAKAGLQVKQFPLIPGEVTAELWRDGRKSIGLTAPDPITQLPFREDNTMVAFSSEFERLCREDFDNAKPFTASMYGDADNDGLPNWFEMYWFGKFQDWSSCTVADPAADPDKDGLTNLQEYQAQSNPTVPAPVYKVGDVWDLSTVHKRKTSFNPDSDFNGTPTWHYLYRIAKPPIPLDGNYKACPLSKQNTPYTGIMSQHSPYKAAGFGKVHGWFDRIKIKGGNLLLRALPRRQMKLILAWESPVNGTVSLSAQVRTKGNTPGTLTIQESSDLKKLIKYKIARNKNQTVKVNDIKIKKGQKVYLIMSAPGNQTSFFFDKLSITLKSITKKR